MDRTSLSANALVSLTGDGETGDQSHQFGNSVNYDVTAKYRLAPSTNGADANAWFVSFDINGEARDHEHLGGARRDSGAHTVSATARAADPRSDVSVSVPRLKSRGAKIDVRRALRNNAAPLVA